MTLTQATDSQPHPTFLPKVSVIVPIYNGEADLPNLIHCLFSQTYPKKQVEYLLVDNNSSDRTPEILQNAAQDAQSQGLQLYPLTEKHIQSSYAARNKAIQASTGEILAFTDADCRPIPEWLNLLVEPFVEPNIGLVVGEIAALPGQTWLEQHAERQVTLTQKYTLDHPFCPYGQTANLAIRRQALAEVGLFRPHLTTGGDADICWRIQRQTPWQLSFAEHAIVQHRHRATLQEFRSQWQRYGRSNKYLHELYGVELQPKLTARKSFYLMSRWFLKELPIASINAIAGKSSFVALLSTPINLYGSWARNLGQQQTQLPEQAKEIEQLQNQN
ncbi:MULTISPECIES: glycosyltransferase [unclassified Coleofasciculus]|uniref:glycosyltransferase n=1 Tax=unclassified Coleofasciculus TaxID=2692782 RepID=UPI00187F4EE9|nr:MULTISPECIES: glycosyltransferase [unclassified Coleofasciculus]MBE9129012.1 glycosyltransferase [Coleofasciculus sp. LEGE 07081]MBE9151563.1 glycosyltransferase [Coleofasciculus sp. LEGE 07092]